MLITWDPDPVWHHADVSSQVVCPVVASTPDRGGTGRPRLSISRVPSDPPPGGHSGLSRRCEMMQAAARKREGQC